jgi:hypothetical protein
MMIAKRLLILFRNINNNRFKYKYKERNCIKMILDMRKKVIPPGYAGHVPCRTEAFGLPEGKALQLSVATYELF